MKEPVSNATDQIFAYFLVPEATPFDKYRRPHGILRLAGLFVAFAFEAAGRVFTGLTAFAAGAFTHKFELSEPAFAHGILTALVGAYNLGGLSFGFE